MPPRFLVNEFLRHSLDGIVSLAECFGYVEDEGVMGVLRESLIHSLLEPLLMVPYRVGTGVVVDSKGHQSGQCDVIIWDDSIFSPLYYSRGTGIYLIESVVAVLEIKSTLNRNSLRQVIQRTRQFKKMAILRPAPQYPNDYWTNEPGILPYSILFGFRSDRKGSERERAQAVAAEQQIPLHDYLQLLVVPGKDSWAFQPEGPRRFECRSDYLYNEVLMPFSGLLNSLKELSAKRGKPNLGAHIVPYSL